MKATIIMALCLGIYSASFSQGPRTYTVAGSITGMPDQEIYLDYYDKGIKYRYKTVTKNGEFRFVGAVSEPVFANIHHENGNGEIELFLDNSTWRVTGAYADYNNATVAGSPIDAQWKKYFAEDQELVSQALAKREKEKQGADAAAMTRAEVETNRKRLLKEYVKQYRNSPSSALIANFCTINKSLSHKDWQEIYDLLSPEIKETHYGKKIKAELDASKPR